MYSTSATDVFKSACFLLAGYMALTQIFRYLHNDDSTSVAYKNFNETPVDRYPTFSICLLSQYWFHLQLIFDNELKTKFGITGREYNQLLRGDDIAKNLWGTTIGFSNISQIDHDQFSIKLKSFLIEFGFETQDEIHAKYGSSKVANESLPFYVSYTDPDTICFTRKSETESYVIRKTDWLSLELAYLSDLHGIFNIYIHHPGQLLRSLGTPNFETIPYHELDEYNKKLSLRLNHVSVLRKRQNAKIPCDHKDHDDDTRFKMEVIKRVGCVPIYWKPIMPTDDSFQSCATSKEMADIFYAIKNKKDIMASYEQPCDYMKVSVGITQHPWSGKSVFMELVYMDENYQEFVNYRDFEFESFWSGVGGFVGIFLGYSLLQVPEVLDKLWGWCRRRWQN